MLRRDGPPCAYLPLGVEGPLREVFFGWLIVELARRHGGRQPLAAQPAVRGRDGGYGRD